MNKFKVGDRVKRNQASHNGMNPGDIDEVVGVPSPPSGGYFLKEYGAGHSESSLELVEDTSKRRKHYDVIIAFANGATIQMSIGNGVWYDYPSPQFLDYYEYRVKPEPKPDVVHYKNVTLSGSTQRLKDESDTNVKYIFDGETGVLKDVQLIK